MLGKLCGTHRGRMNWCLYCTISNHGGKVFLDTWGVVGTGINIKWFAIRFKVRPVFTRF